MKDENNVNPMLLQLLTDAARLGDIARLRCRQRTERICLGFQLTWNRYLKYLQQDGYFNRTSFTEAEVYMNYVDGRITPDLPEYYPAKWIDPDQSTEPTRLRLN